MRYIQSLLIMATAMILCAVGFIARDLCMMALGLLTMAPAFFVAWLGERGR